MFAAAGVLAAAALMLEGRGAPVIPDGEQGPAVVQQPAEWPQIEVVFAVDTTGSMGSLIEGAKEKIWSIASEIARGQPTPILKVGLVAFRDVGDEYVTKVFPLTTDLDSIYVNLRALQAGGGGDTPEHVGRALGEAVTLMPWTADAKTMKLIYVVGDAPPKQHHDGFDANTWAERAHAKGIVVNTIQCGSDWGAQNAFVTLAQLGKGSYFSTAQSGGWASTATPYDDELKTLNAEIATKTLYGGKKPAREQAKKKAAAMGSMSATSAADRLSFFGRSKSGGVASTAAPAAEAGTVDYAAAPAQIALADDADLPEELQALDKSERQAKAEQIAAERKTLEGKAVKLAREREEWLAKNAPEKADSFDANVKESVKKRAAAYGLKY